MDRYKIKQDGTIVFLDRKETVEKTERDKLMEEFRDLEHAVVNSIAHHTDDPEKIARYHELKKILEIPEQADVFKSEAFIKANEKLQSKMQKENNDVLWKNIAKLKKKMNG
ncbi:MAG: hypothetical protein IKM94_03245 [Alphaproteobacteria bacterium]|nr:hypothetical protein [Alphaproteobacteria bacterium]